MIQEELLTLHCSFLPLYNVTTWGHADSVEFFFYLNFQVMGMSVLTSFHSQGRGTGSFKDDLARFKLAAGFELQIVLEKVRAWGSLGKCQ